MSTNKRGRLSEEEREFIRQNAQLMKPDAIAKKLNRTRETVCDYILRHVERPKPIKDETEQIEIRQDLYQSEKWKRLQQELTKEEIKYFEEEYVKLMGQFKQDVLASEETQVFDAIRFDLLKSRNLIERRKAREDIGRLEEMQQDFLKGFEGDVSRMDVDDKALALNLESQLQMARAAEQSRTTEYVKLQGEHQALMKSLKAVRDQRVKAFEERKTSFLGVIKMLNERDAQELAGREMELMRLAGEKESESLGRPIKYDNGDMDNPILSADTVDLGPETENAEPG